MSKYGYIQANGEWLVEPMFHKAAPFYGDYAKAYLAYRDASSPAMSGCSIDRKGRVTPIRNLHLFSNFVEGLCHCTSEDGQSGKIGFVNASGKIALPCVFTRANHFWKGRAIVTKIRTAADGAPYNDPEFVLIDKRGHELRRIGVKGSIVYDWSDGVALCRPFRPVCRPEGGDDDRDCYVDYNGNIVARTPEDLGSDFSEGLAAFSQSIKGSLKSIHGYIDKTGRVVIGAQFDSAQSFSEGLAGVRIEASWHYIDKTGGRVINLPADCSRVRPFSNGLAAVQLGGTRTSRAGEFTEVGGGKWGFIDRKGKVVIEPMFEGVGSAFTEDGLCSVCEEIDGQKLYGFIDREGKYVIRPRFSKAFNFSSGIAAVQVADSEFNPEAWHDWQNTDDHPDRHDALAAFFRSYPVFGMQRSQVHAVLGEGKLNQLPWHADSVGERVEAYQLDSGFCANSLEFFELLYENDVVVGWRTSALDDQPPFNRNGS